MRTHEDAQLPRADWFSYHGGHSGQFCRHAKGQLRAVVERAAALGFTSYGVSEHCPRIRDKDLFPDEAGLTPHDLERSFQSYIGEARALQEEFRDRLEILVGFETEALPEATGGEAPPWLGLMKRLREESRVDYIVGSVHSVGGVPIDYTPQRLHEAQSAAGSWPALCHAYFEEVAQLVEQLRPEVTGHLDLIRRFSGFDVDFPESVWPSIEAALSAVDRAGSLLEINAAPVRRGFGPVYPSLPILRRAQERGIPVTFGDDSHGPQDVGGGLDACAVAASKAGYTTVTRLYRTAEGLGRSELGLEQFLDNRG